MDRTLRIGDDVFSVSPLTGERSFLLQPLIAPAMADFGALFALFVRAFASGDEEPKIAADEEPKANAVVEALDALEQAGPVIARLCSKLPPEQLRTIIRELLAGATMNGKPLYSVQGNPIDVLLQGRTMDFWRLLIHAMRVTYPDFFSLLRGLGVSSRGAANSTPSSTSNPGSVGDSG
jgi:hypothetical protein